MKPNGPAIMPVPGFILKLSIIPETSKSPRNYHWNTSRRYWDYRFGSWDQEEIFTTIDHVDKWHEKIGMADMVNHKFLTDDLKVEQTEFSSGDSIICNFSEEAVNVGGKKVKSGGYIIDR